MEKLLDNGLFVLIVGIITLVIGIFSGFSMALSQVAADCEQIHVIRMNQKIYECSLKAKP